MLTSRMSLGVLLAAIARGLPPNHPLARTVKCGRCGTSETYERPVGALGRPPKYCRTHRTKPHVSVNLRNAWTVVDP